MNERRVPITYLGKRAIGWMCSVCKEVSLSKEEARGCCCDDDPGHPGY